MHQSQVDVANASAVQYSSDINIKFTTSINTENAIPISNSPSCETKPLPILNSLLSSPIKARRSSNTSTDQSIKRIFDAFYDPISDQDHRRFVQYFGDDISEKTFTVDKFCKDLKIGLTLGRRILSVFGLSELCETNSILGYYVLRILRLLWNHSTSVKVYILFKLFDENNDDKLSIDEIRSFYEKYLSELNLPYNQGRLKEVVNIVLKGFFLTDNDIERQEFDFDQFHKILQGNPDVFQSIYLISIPDQETEEEKHFTWYQRWWMYLNNNANRVLFITLYFLIMISLINYRSVYPKNQKPTYTLAHIGGILINFNFAVAISLMLRQIITIIRRIRYLRLIIPVDDHIDAHRLVGIMLFLSAMLHTIAHTVHFAIYTDKHSWVESMFTTAAGVGWVKHSAPITGVILLVLFIIMFIFSLQVIRERPGFYKLFHYTHLLFWPIFILLLLHSKDFWKWTVGPMGLFILEKLYLLRRYIPNHGRTRILLIRIEDDQIITLIIEWPEHFKFSVGAYINLHLPHISRMEWHPFTICSAPERKDSLHICIRKKKNWTQKVYDYYYKRLKNFNDTENLTVITTDTATNSTVSNSRHDLSMKEISFSPEDDDAIIYIEGPFSGCTSYMFDCEHVILIGAGIGITPSISALDSLIHRLREQHCICHKCGAININHNQIARQKLKKVDFFWINPDFHNFSWFQDILNQLETEQESYLNGIPSNTTDPDEQRSRYLDIHLYCTLLRNDAQAMLGNSAFHLAADVYAAKQQKDMVTQLKTRTRVGRPPWRLVFAKFKAEYKSTNVFFTGDRKMAREIKRLCNEFRFQFQHEPYS